MAPRTLPLVASVLHRLSVERADPGPILLALWFRNRENSGYLEVVNATEVGWEAGYYGARAARSTRERMDQLVELGFIRTEPGAGFKHRHVLLIDPNQAIWEHYQASPDRFPRGWWAHFTGRCVEAGLALPGDVLS